MKGDYKVSLHEFMIRVDRAFVESFVLVLGRTSKIPELQPDALRLIKSQVLINSTPCAAQSARSPTVGKVWMKSLLFARGRRISPKV